MSTWNVRENIYVVVHPSRAEFRVFLDPIEARNFSTTENGQLWSLSVYQTAGDGISLSNMTKMSADSVARMHTWTPLAAQQEERTNG